MRRTRIAVSVFLAVAIWAATPAADALAARGYRGAIDIRFPTVPSARYSNDYRAARSGGRRHAATDLFAPAGSPVFAARAGRVIWMPSSEHPTAGFSLWIRDGRGRTYAYYHLGRAGDRRRNAIARGIREGSWVRRGQFIARVGDSGNAAGGTPHLHFEIQDPAVADPWAGNRRNPYWSLLRAQGRRPHRSATPRSSSSWLSTSLLRRGARGPAVTAWQRNLNRATRGRLATDGIFGPGTHAATVRFQRSAGLGPQGLGVVGPRTQAAMQRRLARRDAAPRRLVAAVASASTLLRQGSRGAAVATWQRQLNRVRRAGLVTDGIFGPGTHAATVRFQRSAGLGPAGLGIVGPKTRAAMARRLR